MSLFSAVEMAPRDPILGLNEQFNADSNPAKVNLGVGVYYDDNGKLPLLKCVQAAEKTIMETPKPRGYLPIDGIAAYDAGVKALVFGAQSDVVTSGRVATVQAIGGTGGLKIGADFLKRLNPQAQVLISDPSWENTEPFLPMPVLQSIPTRITMLNNVVSIFPACWAPWTKLLQAPLCCFTLAATTPPATTSPLPNGNKSLPYAKTVV